MYILNTCVVFRNLKKKKLICCILDQSFRLHLILFGPVMRSVSSVRRTLVLNIRTVRVLVGKSWVSVGGNWNVSFIYFITHYAAPQLWVNVSYFLCDSSYSAADDVLARAPMKHGVSYVFVYKGARYLRSTSQLQVFSLMSGPSQGPTVKVQRTPL